MNCCFFQGISIILDDDDAAARNALETVWSAGENGKAR